MRLRCPADPGHDRFVAVRHLEETDTLDGDGNVLETDTRAQRQGPPECAVCGATATVGDD